MKFSEFVRLHENKIIAYHGTDKDFNSFEKSKSTNTFILMSPIEIERDVFFFTTDKNYAKEYGKNIIKVELDVKKLLNDADEKSLAKILLPLLEKEKTGWFYNDGYTSDKVNNLYLTDNPLEKTHWVCSSSNKSMQT